MDAANGYPFIKPGLMELVLNDAVKLGKTNREQQPQDLQLKFYKCHGMML
jgi:hypothetical protein